MLLVHVYSSQLGTHGRLVIGLAVILLTLLQIRPSEPWERNVCLLLGLHVQPGYIYYIGILLAASAFWFVFMRHFVYGFLINAATVVPAPEGEDMRQGLIESVQEAVLSDYKILEVIPTSLFYSRRENGRRTGWTRQRGAGVLLCFVLGGIITACLWILIK